MGPALVHDATSTLLGRRGGPGRRALASTRSLNQNRVSSSRPGGRRPGGGGGTGRPGPTSASPARIKEPSNNQDRSHTQHEESLPGKKVEDRVETETPGSYEKEEGPGG